MRTLWLTLLVCVLLSASARAETLAIAPFAANPAAKEQAPAVEALVATEVAKTAALKVISQQDLATLLGIERRKQLLGSTGDDTCQTDACMTELAGAAGARYVLAGRVDRFGAKYVLTASMFDSNTATAVAKLQAEASDDAGIPDAVRTLASSAVESLHLPSAPPPNASANAAAAAAQPGKFSLGLKVGNAFLANIAKFNLSGDLELGYRFDPEWVGFLQVGASLIRPENEPVPEQFAIVPSVLGARHLYRVKERFQPFWALGLGVQLTLAGKFGPFSQTGPLPTVLGFAGFQYLVTDHLALGIEGSTNLAQATLGLTSDGRGDGFNLDLNGSVAWRF